MEASNDPDLTANVTIFRAARAARRRDLMRLMGEAKEGAMGLDVIVGLLAAEYEV